MVARREIMKAAAALPFLAGLSRAPIALADDDDPDKGGPPMPSRLLLNPETLSGTLAAGGTSYQDSAGNTYVTGAVYTGAAGGTVSGTFRLDLNVFTPAGSSNSAFWGSLVIVDTAQPPNIAFGTVSGQQTPAASGFTDNGRFTVDGGLGTHLRQHDQGTLHGTSTAALNASGSISWTLQSVPGVAAPPGKGKGRGH